MLKRAAASSRAASVGCRYHGNRWEEPGGSLSVVLNHDRGIVPVEVGLGETDPTAQGE